MKAILISGPLHGHLIDIHTATCIKVFNREEETDVCVYTRRPDLPTPKADLAVFVPSEISPDQLEIALRLAATLEAQEISRTTGSYSYLKIDDDL